MKDRIVKATAIGLSAAFLGTGVSACGQSAGTPDVIKTVKSESGTYDVTVDTLGKICVNGTLEVGRQRGLWGVSEVVLSELQTPATDASKARLGSYLHANGGEGGRVMPYNDPSAIGAGARVRINNICSVAPANGDPDQSRVLVLPVTTQK